MKLSKKHIRQIQDYFKTQPVLKAYLFGSYVRGEATKESDVDLLVELDYSQRIGLHYVQMIFDLEELLHKKVDLIPEDSVSKYVKPYIEAEKKIIYERSFGG
ncbi:nucleotidyltransferase family protein [Runella salmonicolor]|uniref:Nucleotidyltransferase domain-containing protein n=1 Tax=Runella salmonicolor TaxID=2950278 RepID=A0ABT1FKD0_9BACT|nr:nucleotidyltransferase domain-containing protein [Runella salmonicolor]MCP1382238.1 nucleotidyltransferase domain-containing protein [Runella salmonicolor]